MKCNFLLWFLPCVQLRRWFCNMPVCLLQADGLVSVDCQRYAGLLGCVRTASASLARAARGCWGACSRSCLPPKLPPIVT